ncbi:MAG: HNH endonuclease signature motif containing protein [bacterium]|nr:HNH endonuclease signature motif containing protein [bacterium]
MSNIVSEESINRPLFNILNQPTTSLKTIEKVKITFTADRSFVEKIESLKNLLSGKYPQGVSLENLFTEAIELYIDKKSPEKRSQKRVVKLTNEKTNKEHPNKVQRSKVKITKRHIPVILRDEIFIRDNGCCSFISLAGQRCSSKWDLEVDHVQPFMMGGNHTSENLRLLCRAHNVARNSDEFKMAAGF